MNNPSSFMANYGYQPLQGPGSTNYMPAQSALPGSYLNSMTQYGTTPAVPTGFDWTSGLQKVGQGLGFAQSIANIYGMFKSLGLQSDAFKFAQAGTKRNFNAEATSFNNEIADRELNRTAYAAANPDSDYGSMSGYGGLEKIEKWT